MPPKSLREHRAQMLLDAVQFIGRQILAVRHRLDPLAGTAYADEFLDMAVPWRDIVVADGPGDPISVTLRRRKIAAAPARAGAAPDQRFPADLVATHPVKRFLLDVGMVRISDEKMRGGGVATCGPGDQRILFLPLPGIVAAQWKFPPGHIHGRVILDVPDVPPALKNQGLQTFFAEFLGRPAAADAAADHDRIELSGFHQRPRIMNRAPRSTAFDGPRRCCEIWFDRRQLCSLMARLP